jgi:putative transposase
MQRRFCGLTLAESDREKLEQIAHRGDIEAWRYKRCRALLLLGAGRSITEVRETLGCADHNVRRWVRTFQSHGVEAALCRRHGGGVEKKLSASEEQRVIALCCSTPPEGRARWTIRLLAEHAEQILDGKRVGREKVRLVLKANDLKPWREKNVVRGEARRAVRGADGRSAPPV